MSDILQEAEEVRFTQEQTEFREAGNLVGLDKDYDFYELCDYLNIKKDDFENSHLMERIGVIHEWAKERGEDVVAMVRDLDIQLGKPVEISRINKLYTWVLLDKEEIKDIQEITEIRKHKSRLYGQFEDSNSLRKP